MINIWTKFKHGNILDRNHRMYEKCDTTPFIWVYPRNFLHARIFTENFVV